MSAMKFTARQTEAIEKRGEITVAASAGAGKTGVLVERLCRLVEQSHYQVSEILAMTFTEAAAAEMKKRLQTRLRAALAATDPADQDQISFLKEQIALTPAADVCTIDSFCNKLVKNHSYAIGWDPDRCANVFDNNTLDEYKNRAAHDVILAHCVQDDPVFVALCAATSSSGSNTDALEELLRKAANSFEAETDPVECLQKARAFYQDYPDWDHLPESFRDGICGLLRKDLDRYLNEARNYCTYVCSTRVYPAAKQYESAVQAFYQQTSALLEQKDIDGYSDLLKNVAQDKNLVPPTSTKIFGRGKKDDDTDAYRKSLKDKWDNLLQFRPYSADIVASIRYQKPYISLFLDMVREYLDRFAEIKEINGGIDFTDMERGAIRLLKSHNGQIANQLRWQYREIMVDEYQDSNEIQEELVQLICRNHPGNVFRVGDVKQSIYGFRGARPALMRSMLEKCAHDPESTAINLDKNFRSKKAVVEFNNVLYRRLMNIPGYHDTYTDERDKADIGSPRQQENSAPVEIDLFDSEEFKGKAKSEYWTTVSTHIVSRIVAMKQDPENPYDHWRDYVILSRTHAFKTYLEKAFQAAGIPYFFETVTGYYDDIAVSAVLSWLSWLYDQSDEIDLFAVLSSPYYGYTDEDLAQLRLQRQSHQSWFDLLTTLHHAIIEDYHKLKQIRNLRDLVVALYQLHDFYENKTTLQQRDNLNQLFDYVLEADHQNLTLGRFVDWIRVNRNADEGSAVSLSSEADVVRVTTIHKSKGLQYPVVFVVAGVLGKMPASANYQYNPNIGFSLKEVHLPYRETSEPMLWKLISRQRQSDLCEEAIRLLYVATTRAQDRMIIVAQENTAPYARVSFTSDYLEEYAGQEWIAGNLIHAAMHNCPVEYFRISHIALADVQLPAPIQAEPISVYTQPHYTKPLVPLTDISPSSLEERFLAPLHADSTDHARRGTTLHKAFELLDLTHFTPSDLDQLPLELDESDKQRISAFFHTDLYRDELSHMDLYQELPFMIEEGSQLVHGFMDLVAVDDIHVILIDFKSDQNVTPEILLDRYTGQLHSYRDALSSMNKPVTSYLYSIELEQFIQVPD